MKTPVITLMVILSCTSCSHTHRIGGSYESHLGEFHTTLLIKRDSSFQYHHWFSHGATRTSGKWKVYRDTIELYGYENPCGIGKVQEEFREHQGDSIIIQFDIDDSAFQEIPVKSFFFWINDDCDQPLNTDSNGITFLKDITLKSISFEYDTYEVKNPEANYFSVSLTNYPIYQITSPQPLPWKYWIIQGNSVMPIHCGKPDEAFELKNR